MQFIYLKKGQITSIGSNEVRTQLVHRHNPIGLWNYFPIIFLKDILLELGPLRSVHNLRTLLYQQKLYQLLYQQRSFDPKQKLVLFIPNQIQLKNITLHFYIVFI